MFQIPSQSIPTAPDRARVPVGSITLRGGHFPDDGSAPLADVIAHYDETDAQVSYVVAGEDEHGPWIAGSIRSTITGGDLPAMTGDSGSGGTKGIRC